MMKRTLRNRRHRWREALDSADDNSENARYIQARKRARALRAFYGTLGSFFFVNLILFTIDVLTGDGWWFYWVTIFWGLALVMQAFRLFNPLRIAFDDEWEERKIRELMGEKSKRSLDDDAETYFEKS